MLDPEFSKLFASGEINKFARAAPPIDQLVYLVDRDAQESAYARAYDSPSVMPRPRLPLVCVLPGAAEYRHAPDELPVRLAKKTLPEISTWPTNDSFVGLTWPDRSSSLEEGLADLRYGLWKALCGPAGASPPRDPNAYKALWSDDTRPRLLRSDLTQRPLNKWMAHLLSAWCSFLTAAAPAGERRITHLLMVSSTAEEVHRWRQRHRETIAHPVFALAELQQCNHSDLVDWLNDRLGKQLPGHQEKLISELGRRLLGQFRGPFFVDDLRASIRSALEAVRV
jgi:hypothetical protein